MRIFTFVAFLLVLAASSLAQWGQPFTGQFDKTPIREVITTLLGSRNLPFKVSSDVKGNVTLKAERELFEDVLRDVMLQTNAIYEIIGHQYVIRPMEPASKTLVRTIDSNLVVPHVGYEGTDVRLAVKELMGKYGIKYTMPETMRGTITVELRRIRLRDALSNLLRQVDGYLQPNVPTVEIIPGDEYRRLVEGPPPPQ